MQLLLIISNMNIVIYSVQRTELLAYVYVYLCVLEGHLVIIQYVTIFQCSAVVHCR